MKVDAAGNELPHTLENELWNRNPYEPERITREINFKTNVFMQNLYEAAKDDEVNPGRLNKFLTSLVDDGSAQYVDGVWVVNAERLNYELRYAY